MWMYAESIHFPDTRHLNKALTFTHATTPARTNLSSCNVQNTHPLRHGASQRVLFRQIKSVTHCFTGVNEHGYIASSSACEFIWLALRMRNHCLI